MEQESVVLGVMSISEAKRIQSAMEDRGVRLRLVSNPHTCTTGGCTPTVELHALSADLEAVKAFFLAERERNHGGLEFNPELLDEVFDPEKESARCPACGDVFSTSLAECPGCGLGFGGG